MDLYEKYRLTRIINANGKMTALAGAIVLPEIVETVDEAMGRFFSERPMSLAGLMYWLTWRRSSAAGTI